MLPVLNRKHIYFIIIIFLLYVLLAFIFSGFYSTIPLIFKYAQTLNWFKLSVSLSFFLIIGILIAFNAVYGYIFYKQRKSCLESNTLTGIGTIGGLATGVCPLCIIGLFPIVFGFFGISFSFATLPFQGIEVQGLTIIVLGISLYLLGKRNL